MKGKYAVVEALRREGVRYVFGNPGTSEMPILELVAATQDLRYVLALQEGVAMGMADGYARAARRPAFVQLHRDTGLANGVSLLINSAHGGTPLVLSAVNTDQRKLLEERTDLAQMVSQFTKLSLEVPRAELIPAVFSHAFRVATRSPAGPVFVSLPFDVLDDEAGAVEAPRDQHAPASPDRDAIAEAATVLAASSSTALLLGDRVAEAGAVRCAVRLAEVLDCAVYAAHTSEVNFPTGHPLFRGVLPVAGDGVLAGVAAVLAVGTSVLGGFFYLPGNAFGPETRLIHLDSSPSAIGRNEPTDIGIPGDIAEGLRSLHRALEDAVGPDDARRTPARRRPPIAARNAGESNHDVAAPMPADELMHALGQALPANAVVVEDAGTASGALHRAIEFNEPGRLHGVRGGAMGWGMGAALGVQLADRTRRVIGVVGDGTAAMTVQALWTAAREQLPVVYVVCNNASYRALAINAQTYRRVVPGVEVDASADGLIDLEPALDYAQIAQAFGVYGRRILDAREIGPAVAEAMSRPGPTLLDVAIDGT